MAIGALIRDIREARCWSQDDLADALNAALPEATITRSLVSRYESEKRLPTSPHLVKALADVLQIEENKVRAEVRLSRVERRAFLAVAGAAATIGRERIATTALGEPAPTPLRRIGMSDVDVMRSRFARLRDLDNYLGGADTFQLYADELTSTERVLAANRFSKVTGDALADLVSEQAQQAGWAAFDAGDSATAQRLFAASHRISLDTGNADLAANALIHSAYADPTPGAIESARVAGLLLTQETPPQTRALLASRQAWSYAVAGNAREANAALEWARQALTAPTTGPAPHWSAWINETEIDIMTGRVWSVLHDPTRAIPPLERALATFPDQWSRDKALYLLFLADALTDAGDAEYAAEVVDQATTLAATVASPRPIRHARSSIQRLANRDVPGARAVAERLAELILPSRPAP